MTARCRDAPTLWSAMTVSKMSRRSSELILPPLKPRRHLPIFYQPPRRDREHAAVGVAVPVGVSHMGPHRARLHRRDFALVAVFNLRLPLVASCAAVLRVEA